MTSVRLPKGSEREPRFHSKTGRIPMILNQLSRMAASESRPGNGRISLPMRSGKKLVVFAVCVLLVAQASAAARRNLTARIDTVLAAPDLTRGFWGVEVVSLDSGKVLFSQNAEKLF